MRKNKKGVKNSKIFKAKTAAIVAAIGVLMTASGLTGYKLVKDDGSCACGLEDFGVVERVVDGDTLLMESGERVRIIGIDAPSEGECYFDESLKSLKKLIEGKEVRLDKDVSGVDRYGRLLRYVILPNLNKKEDDLLVGNYLVENGLAQAVSSAPDLRFRQTLVGLQQEAVRKELGIWGECEDLKAEAKENWQASVEPSDPDCLIKGNISQHESGLVYYLPDCDNYKTTKIDPARGEKYFCTEKEAQEAGFRKAENCPE
jgi:micrococcal nuclease